MSKLSFGAILLLCLHFAFSQAADRGMLVMDLAGGMQNEYQQTGCDQPGVYELALRFTPDELINLYGQNLKNVNFLVKGDGNGAATWRNIKVKVYKGSSSSGKAPGVEVFSANATNVAVGYFTSVAIPGDGIKLEFGSDYWLAYEIDVISGYPFGCDAGPAKPGKSQWIKKDGQWLEFGELGPGCNTNWLIRGIALGTSITDTHAPLVTEVRGVDAVGNTPMNLEVKVADRSALPDKINGVYTVNGSDVSFDLNKVSGVNLYKGIIPANTFGTTGTVKFTLKDNLNNTSVSEAYKINWLNSPIFEESFDALTAPALPTEWKVVNNNNDQTVWITGTNSAVAYSAPNVAYIRTSSYNIDTDDWLVSKGISMKAGIKYNLRFKYRAAQNSTIMKEYLTAYVGTGQTVQAMLVKPALWKDLGFQGENWREGEVIFTPANDGVYYLGLHAMQISDKANMILVDNISVYGHSQDDVVPPQFVSLTGGNAPLGQPVKLKLRVSDLSGLKEVKGYYKLNNQSQFSEFSMQFVAHDGDYFYEGQILSPAEAITGVVKFTAVDNSTAQNSSTSQEYPIAWIQEYTEGFEGQLFPPEFWYAKDFNNDGNCWKQSNSPQYNIHTGARVAYSTSYPSLPDDGLITPVYKVKADGKMIFWVAPQDPNNFKEKYSVGVAVRQDEASSFFDPSLADFVTVMSEEITGAGWKEKSISLSNYVGKQIRIIFRHHSTGVNFFLNLDDVKFVNCDFQPIGYSDIESQQSFKKHELSVNNYPNPFNPETKITYNLPASGNMVLSIFDAKGALVETVDRGVKPLGSHTVTFNASGLTSGIYFCTLFVDGKVQVVHKMMLLK